MFIGPFFFIYRNQTESCVSMLSPHPPSTNHGLTVHETTVSKKEHSMLLSLQMPSLYLKPFVDTLGMELVVTG